MEAWISEALSDEEVGTTTRGKSVIIRGTKAEMRAIADFMSQVVQHLEHAEFCHMHLRDSMAGWSKSQHIDLEVTVEAGTV